MENLKVKKSEFKTHLSFNEWVKELNVSRDYVAPTPYFKDNPKDEYYRLFEQKPEPLMWRIRQAAASVINAFVLPM